MDGGDIVIKAVFKSKDVVPLGLIIGLSVGGAVIIAGGIITGIVFLLKKQR